MKIAIKKLFAYLATMPRLRAKPSSALEALDMRVARLTLQPGDAVVISSDRHLNREQADQIRALTDRALPPDVKVIVLPGGLAMTVLRKDGAATSDRSAITEACQAAFDRRADLEGAAPLRVAPPPRRP